MNFATTGTSTNGTGEVTVVNNFIEGAETVPAEALEIREAATIATEGGSAVDEDGNVLIHVIRPGVGRGRGRHLYEADMLERDSHVFAGMTMYQNHLSEQARKALGGLPRPLDHVGGIVLESWWDGDVPASDRFGQGAVMAKVRPTPFVKELIETHPDIVQTSISATATGVRPVTKNGQKVWLVEGIGPHGSVDWVTQGGAGGRIVALVESYYGSEDQALLESLTDQEFIEHLRAERPSLLESLTVPDSEETPTEGENMAKADELREALANDPGFAEVISQIVDARVNERLEEAGEQAPVLPDEETLREAVQVILAEERELIHAEARANADRQIQLRELRSSAHDLIEAAKLPDTWKAEIKSKYSIHENQPSVGLDVVDEIDDEGEVTRTAEDRLTESVNTEISRQRELLAAANPTRVRGQGPKRASQDGEESTESEPKSKGTLYGAVLQEAGIDPEEAYAERS